MLFMHTYNSEVDTLEIIPVELDDRNIELLPCTDTIHRFGVSAPLCVCEKVKITDVRK